MAYIIGIDSGTTNTKAVAFTRSGEVLASAGCSYSILPAPPGYHELDPNQLLEAVIKVLTEVLGKVAAKGRAGSPQETGAEGMHSPQVAGNADTDGAGQLAGISFSCAMHSLIAVDAAGSPLTAAITWADLRSTKYADALKASPAGRDIYRNTGTPVHPMSPLCKLLWLRDQVPAVFRQAAKFISIKEYIWWRLFGKYQVDYSIASATGLFDIFRFGWYPGSLELAGLRADQLSEPVPCTHTETELLPEFRDRLNLPFGLPWVIGGSDGCLANLGSLAIGPGETALTIGTSGAVRMTTGVPVPDPKERTFHYVLTRDRYVSGGAINNGGGVVKWFTQQFPARSGEAAVDIPQGSRGVEEKGGDLSAEAGPVAPGCEGLIFLPYLQGERAPLWDAKARGMFFGIRSGHTHAHFMRAVLEGISFSLHSVGQSLEETIGPIRHIYASGGFIHSEIWLQLIADVFNRRVMVTNAADASAIGAVIMGFHALGMLDRLEDAAEMIQVRETFEPDAERHAVYSSNELVFSALYERLKDLM